MQQKAKIKMRQDKEEMIAELLACSRDFGFKLRSRSFLEKKLHLSCYLGMVGVCILHEKCTVDQLRRESVRTELQQEFKNAWSRYRTDVTRSRMPSSAMDVMDKLARHFERVACWVAASTPSTLWLLLSSHHETLRMVDHIMTTETAQWVARDKPRVARRLQRADDLRVFNQLDSRRAEKSDTSSESDGDRDETSEDGDGSRSKKGKSH